MLTCNSQYNISSTQEIVELILDANRNNLLALDLKVSILTMGLGAGALFASLFGMNVCTNFCLRITRYDADVYLLAGYWGRR